MPPITPATNSSNHPPYPVPATELINHQKIEGEDVSKQGSSPKNPAPLSNASVQEWIADIERKVESEKLHLESDGRLHKNENGQVAIDPTVSEKFFGFLRSGVDFIAGLLGKKEQSVLSGYCAVSALVRGTTPALRQLGSARGFGITGLILTSAYLVTTCMNLATAVSAYAKSYATQGEHLEWIINNLPAVKEFLKDTKKATPAQAKIFNEFMLRIENVKALMTPVKSKEETNKTAASREFFAMLPGGIISEASGANIFTNSIPALASGVLSEAAAGFQVAGGVLDIKQSVAEKDIVRMNIAATRAKKKALEGLAVTDSVKNINTYVTAFSDLQKSLIHDHESQSLNTDFRLFKGSMAIPAGLAGATFTAFLIAKAFGVFVLASATIALTLTALSALSGVILLAFLGRLAYVAYRGWESAQKALEMSEKAKACVSNLSPTSANSSLTEFPRWEELDSNPYLKLDQLAKILVNGEADCGFQAGLQIFRREAESILVAVGIPRFHLESLLIEAKDRGVSGVEWFKSQIGKYLNIDYSFTEESTVPLAKSEASSVSRKYNVLPLRPTNRALI